MTLMDLGFALGPLLPTVRNSPRYRSVPKGRRHATTREAAEATATELLRLGPVSRQVSRQAKRLALKAQRHR